MRGMLTSKIQEISIKYIGREISLSELRLIPYIQYVLCNEQVIEIHGRLRKVNNEEIEILKEWEKHGYIHNIYNTISVSKEFWDFMCEILWYSYVYKNEEEDQNG